MKFFPAAIVLSLLLHSSGHALTLVILIEGGVQSISFTRSSKTITSNVILANVGYLSFYPVIRLWCRRFDSVVILTITKKYD